MKMEGIQDLFAVYCRSVWGTMVSVIRDPVEFYRRMEKAGGFREPLLFVLSMGVLVALIGGFLSVFSAGFHFYAFLASLVIGPLMFSIFSFVGAGVFFIIWRIIGSEQSYETAYRCIAYASAVTPVTMLLGIIPYLGSLAGILWMLYLVVTATVEVHGVEARKAWTLFGVLFFLLILVSMGSQYSARQVAKQMQSYGDTAGETGGRSTGTPQEQGRE
ncbi:MAG TPA: YIP1 family protein [Syntrophales bacterium]|mgnify:CR=1 FL=1|nr:YIP1 family protein [Syntrophales bacterium]